METTLETSGKDGNYTRNEWEKLETTLETSGKDGNYTRNEWEKLETTLETSAFFSLLLYCAHM